MSPGAIGAFCLVLVVVFIVGNLWFHLVEALLRWVKGWLPGHREAGSWHPLPKEPEEQEDANQKS